MPDYAEHIVNSTLLNRKLADQLADKDLVAASLTLDAIEVEVRLLRTWVWAQGEEHR